MQNLILTPLSIEQLQNLINDAVKIGIEQTLPAPKDQTRLLTRKEVCELLNITLVTLHEWTKNGTIAAYKVGSRVRYKQSEVFNTLQRIKATKKREV
jgi:excisionase family DNA binding protein